MPALLSRREVAIWIVCFLIVSALLVAVRFTSDDPDSALHAALSARLAEGPPSRWIAPEWWGEWDHHGLYREHPAGILFLPTLMGAAGVPAVQASYIVGIAAGLVAVLLLAHLVSRITNRDDARAVLVLLQLMPLASIFRIRANHEYPMLVWLLLTLIGLDAVRRSWRWIWVVPFALTAAFLVKGVFVAVPLVAAGLWMVINPTGQPSSIRRPIAACLLSIVLMGLVAMAYDAAYVRVTGESFWGGYWARQLAPLTIATPASGGGSVLVDHGGFYLLRVLWHPAPWSWALLLALWTNRRGITRRWRAWPPSWTRGLAFSLGAAGAIVVMLTPASRFAERYIFSANYLIATAGIVVALHAWPTFARTMTGVDRRAPAAAALLWTALMLLRLVLGPFLPRISG